VLRFFRKWFDGARQWSPDVLDDDGHGVIRFRPRLIAQLTADHASLRENMRAVLDACRVRNEDAQILGLQRFAETFRRVSLVKAVQFYPYLLWALAQDRLATDQLGSVRAEVQLHMHGIDALLRTYLQAPWLSSQRRQLFGDVARIAHLLAQACQREESALFSLYLPPGQYRRLRSV
jgi:hypothetical protein